MIKKLAALATTLTLATVMSFAVVPSAHAAAKKKVDCDKVMEELNAGKKPKEVAQDLGVRVGSVYRCKKKAAKAAGGAMGGAMASPAAEASPAAPK